MTITNIFRVVRIFEALVIAATLPIIMGARGVQRSLSTVISPASASASAAQAFEVIDEFGRHVTIPANLRRIVSLAPSLTETVYALDAQDRLVGVTNYCDYPPQAQSKTHIGGTINPNLEQVVSLHPDLVLATRQANRLETVEALTRLGIPVYATDPKSVDDVIESTRRLGSVLGARARGEALALDLRARLEDIKHRVGAQPPRRVFFVVWPQPLISIGRNTFLADALRRAGAQSVVETAQDWPRLSIEEVIRQQPEFLVFSSTHFEEAAHTVEELSGRAGWRSLDAIRNQRIAIVSDAINRPSPRLVDAVQQLARQFHPEAFEETPKTEKMKSKFNLAQHYSVPSPVAQAEAPPCAR